jgi:tetratricopeptide (TPR) repeat protein
MSQLSDIKDLLFNLYIDPDKEDNWTHVEDALRNREGIENLADVKKEIGEVISRFERHDGWEYVVRLLEILEPMEDDASVKADLFLRMGEIFDNEIFNGKRAKRAYEETLRLRQGDAAASEALNKLKALSDGWRDVVERYLQEAQDTEDGGYRSQLNLQVAALYQKFGGKSKDKLKDVLHYLQLALESDSANKQAVRFLRRLLIEKKQWDEVVALYQRLSEIAKSKEDRADALIEQARVLALRMSRAADAAVMYEQALELSPGNKVAMAFLVNHYTETGESDKLIQLYESVLRSRPGREDEVATLLQIAMVYWRVKGELDKAEDYFKRVKRVVPGHPAALNFYREFYAQTEDWTKLIQVLSETVRVIKEPDECAKIYGEIADISETKLNNLERAIDAYKAILKIRPADAGATAALKERYRKTEKWNALLDILKSELAEAGEDTARKTTLLKDIAAIYRDRLSLDVMVLKTYHQVLDLDPTDEEAVTSLIKVYEQSEKWNDLAVLYEKRLAVESQKERQIGYLRKIADIWMNRLGNFNRATVPLEKILELEPHNVEVLQSLKGIYQQRRMWEQLYAVMKHEGELLTEKEKPAHWAELARLAWEKLGKFPDAIDFYWKILEGDPGNREVLGNLEKLCERGKDWEGLVRVLEMESGQAQSTDDKAALLQKWGTIVTEKLGKPELAAKAWKQLLQTKPGHAKALGALRDLYLGASDWERLTDLYAESGSWEALGEIFTVVADQRDGKEEKISLLFRAADIFEKKVENPTKAYRCYEKIIAIDPENRKAAELVLPIYEKEGNFRRQVDIQLGLLATASGDAEKLAIMKQLVFLYGEKLGNPKDAFARAVEAHALAPDDPDVLQSIEVYGEKTASWDELIAIYCKRAEGLKGNRLIDIQKKLARVLYRNAGRMQEALGVYEGVLEADPDDEEAYTAVEEILKSMGKLADLLALYEKRLKMVKGTEEKVSLLKDMAKIAQEGLDDMEAAARCYRMLLDLRHDDRASIEELETLYRISEKWDDLVDILNRKRGLVEGEEVVDTAAEIAEIYALNLHRYDDALTEAALVLDERPADRKVVGILEKMLSNDEVRIEAARLLEPHLRPLEKYSQYAWVLQILLESSKDPGERMKLYVSLSLVYDENLNDASAAHDTITKALEELPSSEELWGRLDQLADKASLWDKVFPKYVALFSRDDLSDETRTRLARKLAWIGEHKTGDLEAAEKYHRWIFDRDRMDRSSFDALELLYTNRDKYPELKGLYREKADSIADAGEKVELLQKIGFINEDMLENRKDAIEVYKEILDIAGDNDNARRALERLYEQEAQWPELAEHIESNIRYVAPEGLIAAKFKLADILDRKMDQPARAIEYYRQVLTDHPTHLKAQEALERLLGMEAMKFQAAEILEPLYESQGAYTQLIGVLRVRFDGAGSDDERIDILLKTAEVQEKRLRDTDGAFETLSRAFGIDPSREATVQRLEDLVAACTYWSVYVDVLEEAIGKVPEPDLQGNLQFKVAKIHEEKLGDAAGAEEAFRKFLAMKIEDRTMVMASAVALEKIYAQGEKYEDLIAMLQLQVEHSEDAQVRYDLLKRIAEIQETMLGKNEDAIATNLRILEIEPEDVAGILALRRLYEATQKWEDLIAILKRMISLSENPGEKKSLTYEVASFYAEKLGNPEEAIFTYQLIGEEFGEEAAALNALVALYEKIEDHVELVATLDRLIKLSGKESETLELLLRSGTVERDKIGDLPAAVDRFHRILEIDADNAAAMGALEELLHKDMVRLKVARILEPHYERAQSFEKLLAVFDIEIAEEADPEAKARLQRRAAEIAEIGLGDLAKAFGYFSDALRSKLDAAEQASAIIDDLERITRDSNDHKRLVDFYTQIAPDILSEDLQLRIFMTVAETCHKQLGALPAAKEWYTKVLDVAPTNAEAINALEEIYTSLGDYARLIEVLKLKSDITQDPAEKVHLLFQQAKFSEEQLHDESAAIDAYEAVLELEESRDAVHALERLYRSAGRWGNYRDILERQLEWPDTDVVDLHHRLGLTLAENLGDPDGALEHFREALKMRVDYRPTIDVLEKWLVESTFKEQVADILEPIYMRNLKFDKLLGIMEVKLESTSDPIDRKEIYLKMGKIYEEQVEDLEKAFNIYVRMLGEDVESKEVRQNIDRLANVLDIWPRAAEAYRKVLTDVISDTPGTADLWYHLGVVQDSYCDDPESAIASLKRALAFDPSDRRAFSALEGILKRDDRWAQQLYDLYRESVDSRVDAEERRKMMYVMGRLSEEKLGNRQQAIDIWKEVIADDASDETAIAALERLYFYEKRFHDLSDLLLERIDRATNALQQVELKHKLAGIHSEYLEDKDSAVDLYEQILSQDSAYQDSIIALEGMIEDPDRQQRIVEILIPIYKEHNRWQKLIKAYEIELLHLHAPMDRKMRYIEIGKLAETMARDMAMAFGAYASALKEDPADAEVLEKVMGIAEKTEAWDKLAKVLEEAAAVTDMPSIRALLLRWEARVLDRRLGDFREAVDVYKKLLEIEEGDPEALDALDSLYTLLADWEGLLWALDLKAGYTMGQEGILMIRRREGEICEDQLGSVGKAIEYYRMALEIDPADFSSLGALERLYEATEKWTDLVALLQGKLGYLTDSIEKRAAYLKVASIQKEKLNLTDDAISSYMSILDDFHEDVEVMRILDGLLSAERRWEEYYENLQRRAKITFDEEEMVQIMLLMGEVLLGEIQDVDRAIENYRRVLEVRDNEKACEALETIARKEDYRQIVIAILEPIYRRHGDWDRLLSLYRLRFEILSDPTERARALVQIADLQEQGLGDKRGAFETLQQALKEEVWIEDIYSRAQILAEELNQYTAFAKTLEEKIPSIFDTQVAAALNMKVGRIWEERVGNEAKAIDAYKRILDQGVDEKEALDALDRLYQSAGRWEDLLDVIERKLTQQQAEAERSALLLRSAEIKLDRTGDTQGAIQALSTVLRGSPETREAVESLEGLLDRGEFIEEIMEVLSETYRATGNLRKLVDLLDLKARRAETPQDKVEILREEAIVAEEDLKDPDTAMRALLRALWEMPDDMGLLDELERLCDVLGAWDVLTSSLAKIVDEKKVSDDTRKEMSLRIARWAKSKTRDHVHAASWYEKYLAFDPDNAEVLAEFEEELFAVRNYGKLLDVMERREPLEFDAEKKRQLLYTIAELSLKETQQPDRAAEAFEKLYAIDDSNLEVIDSLIELKTAREQWDRVIELLERRIAYTSDLKEANGYRFRLANIMVDVQKDDERAIGIYREILDIDPESADAARWLEHLYEKNEKWFDLKDLLLVRVDRTSDPASQLQILILLAGLMEKRIEDVDGAIDYLMRAYEIAPGSAEVIGALERLLSASGRLEDLIDLLRRRSEQIEKTDPRSHLELLVRIGEIYFRSLGAPEMAVGYYERVLEKDPENTSALSALSAIHEANEDWARCISVLDRAAGGTKDYALMGSIFFKIGTIKQTKMNDPGGALEAYSAVLEVNPDHPQILPTMLALYEEKQDWQGYGHVLEMKLARSQNVDEKVAVLLQLGSLARDKMQDKARRLAYVEQAHELKPRDVAIKKALIDAYLEAGMNDKAAEVIEKLIEEEEKRGVKKSKELSVYLHLLGKVYEQRGQIEQAVAKYEEANKIDLSNFAVNFSLGALYEKQGDTERAMKILRPLLLQNLDSAGIDKADVYFMLGRMHVAKGEDKKAINMLDRGLAANPGHAEMKALLAELKGK